MNKFYKQIQKYFFAIQLLASLNHCQVETRY